MQPITPIPKVAPPAPPPTAADPKVNPVPESAYTGGLWRNLKDGMVYALALHAEDNYFRTHSLKNSHFSWQGSAEEFKQQFERAS
jgi:hypothetical protein